jgi:hypothetical protein
MARRVKDPLLCCDCQAEKPAPALSGDHWAPKRCDECFSKFSAKREANRIAKARRLRAAMDAAGPTPAPRPSVALPIVEPERSPVVEPFPCCGAPNLGGHQDNVTSGTCTREALRAVLHGERVSHFRDHLMDLSPEWWCDYNHGRSLAPKGPYAQA